MHNLLYEDVHVGQATTDDFFGVRDIRLACRLFIDGILFFFHYLCACELFRSEKSARRDRHQKISQAHSATATTHLGSRIL